MKALAFFLVWLVAACSQATWTRPDTTRAQFDRDAEACKAQANSASSGQLVRPADRSKIHNRVLISCMRERGYERQEEREAAGKPG